jgi:hypothetical protein
MPDLAQHRSQYRQLMRNVPCNLHQFCFCIHTHVQHFGYLLDLLVVVACVSNELQSGSKGEKKTLPRSVLKHCQILSANTADVPMCVAVTLAVGHSAPEQIDAAQ